MLTKIKPFLKRPPEYAKSTGKFWDDPHISKGMLASHIDSDNNLATRKEEFVDKSVEWIAKICPPDKYTRLLDMGCGPGIYAEKFYSKGYEVSGIDFSKRSIDYARQSAEKKGLNINYKYENYLEMNYDASFDLAALIWCDYGVLSPKDRKQLLVNIHKALGENGRLIFDVFSKNVFDTKNENKTFEYVEGSGFWADRDYLLLSTVYKYDNRVVNNQNIVITDDEVNCYNIWEHYFDKEELESELKTAGFKDIKIYSDIAGEKFEEDSEYLCVVVDK